MQKSHLLVLNYSISSTHPIFSHQRNVVEVLGKNFENVHIFTRERGDFQLDQNPNVITLKIFPFNSNKSFMVIKMFLAFIGVMTKSKGDLVIFSHMNDGFSASLAIFSRLLRVRHVLWYAHKSRSTYLRLAFPFVSQVLTSTMGSCPYEGKKVNVIGQGIEPELFKFSPLQKPAGFQNGVHIGRIDPSKNILLLLQFLLVISQGSEKTTLSFIGNPTTSNTGYYAEVMKQASSLKNSPVRFLGSMPRDSLPRAMQTFDYFIHAFDGSLDKSILEATFLGLPVITLNREYINQFGMWGISKSPTQLDPVSFLVNEFESMRSLPSDQLRDEISLRATKARRLHSFDNWAKRVKRSLNDEL